MEEKVIVINSDEKTIITNLKIGEVIDILKMLGVDDWEEYSVEKDSTLLIQKDSAPIPISYPQSIPYDPSIGDKPPFGAITWTYDGSGTYTANYDNDITYTTNVNPNAPMMFIDGSSLNSDWGNVHIYKTGEGVGSSEV